MGRYARKISDRQAAAIVAAHLENGRSYADIARAGVPGTVEPGFVTAPTVSRYVAEELERRKRTEPKALERAGDDLLWELHDEACKALERHRNRTNENDFRQLKGAADIAGKLERAIAARPKTPTTRTPPPKGTDTETEDKPSTLADRLENGSNGNNGNGTLEGVDTHAPALPVHVHEGDSSELLNHPATHGDL